MQRVDCPAAPQIKMLTLLFDAHRIEHIRHVMIIFCYYYLISISIRVYMVARCLLGRQLLVTTSFCGRRQFRRLLALYVALIPSKTHSGETHDCRQPVNSANHQQRLLLLVWLWWLSSSQARDWFAFEDLESHIAIPQHQWYFA